MKFRSENFPSHEWHLVGDVKYKSYQCSKCLTRIRDDPAEEFGIFVFQYYNGPKIIEYANTCRFTSKIKRDILNDLSMLTCDEMIIKNIIE